MPRIQWRRPALYPEQKRAIFNSARWAYIEASTKSGKTAGCTAWLVEQALKGRPGESFWWIAPTVKQAEIAYRRTKRGLPRRLYKSNDNEQLITLITGARLLFLTGEKPDNLYGEDVYAAVVDEASRVRQEAFHAVRSTLTATGGPARFIGNVKGRKNWFYEQCRRAEQAMRDRDRHSDMHYAKITAEDAAAAGVFPMEEIEDARRNLPEQVFRELYYAEASDDGGNPFGLDAIQRGILREGLSRGRPRVWGWDLGKVVDYTVGIALDDDGKVCRLERFRKPWAEAIHIIKKQTAGIRAYVDATGVGDPIVEMLQRQGGGNFRGYVFTPASKQQLMEGLAVNIQEGVIRYPPGVIVDELNVFEYEYTRTGVRYAAMEGYHDDCVCALALANHGMRRRPASFDVEDFVMPETGIYASGGEHLTDQFESPYLEDDL